MSGLDAGLEAVEKSIPLGTKPQEPDIHKQFRPTDNEAPARHERQWHVPAGWTTLRHGSNLARDEWKGNEGLLNESKFNVKTRYPGLSCISTDDALRDQSDANNTSSSAFDTTKGYSTTESDGSVPIEIQVALPIIHDRVKTPGSNNLKAAYGKKYPDEMPQVLMFLNETWWRRNQQHPVIPNGTPLTKVDEINENGRRVVRYVPDLLLEIYDDEVSNK